MPPYGIPRNDAERITDGLEWALEMLIRRDQMNAAVHCMPLRMSPVTQKVQLALGAHRATLAAAAVGAVPETRDETEKQR